MNTTGQLRYFRRRLSIFLEFIPQIIFITLIFAYLCLMIFIKWIKYDGSNNSEHGTCAPNLLIGNQMCLIHTLFQDLFNNLIFF